MRHGRAEGKTGVGKVARVGSWVVNRFAYSLLVAAKPLSLGTKGRRCRCSFATVLAAAQMDLVTVHGNRLGRVYAEAHLPPLDLDNGHGNRARNDDLLADPS